MINVLRPHCRNNLTFKDFHFIGSTLSQTSRERDQLIHHLTDPETRDIILDERELFRALLEKNAVLLVSTYFYFYILVRNAFLQKNILDRIIADYVAMVLAEFTITGKLFYPHENYKEPVLYVVDILSQKKNLPADKAFLLESHLANYSLYLTGFFLNFINRRENKKASPGLEYYEQIGMSHYYQAGNRGIASELEVEGLYLEMAEQFRPVREALNDISQDYLHLHQSKEWDKVINLLNDMDQYDA